MLKSRSCRPYCLELLARSKRPFPSSMESNPKQLKTLLSDLPRNRSSLLPALERAQAELRYLPQSALEIVSKHTRTPKSEVYGVASHYPEFRLDEPGRRVVRVCTGMACVARGAAGLLADAEREFGIIAGQTTPDRGITLEEATCLFNCPIGPSVEIDHRPYGHATLELVGRLVSTPAQYHPPVRQPDETHKMRLQSTGRPREQLASLVKAADSRRQSAGADLRLLVGAGSCANSVGASEVVEALRQSVDGADISAEVVEAGCNGMCYGATLVTVVRAGRPAVTIVGVKPDGARALVDAMQKDDFAGYEAVVWSDEIVANAVSYESHPFFSRQRRVLSANFGMLDPSDIDEYLVGGGYAALARAVDELSPDEVIEEVKQAGLLGRGGAYFPAGIKWAGARGSTDRPKYLVVNAEEGEPGIYKDRHLMEGDPHRLIEGAVIAAYAIGASRVIFYVNGEARLAQQRLELALRQADSRGLIGKNVLGSGVDVEYEVRHGAGGYVLGEETALLESIEGYRAMPRVRPPFPTESGLWGKPTVINNAETLANVVGILRHGAKWYSSLGVKEAHGTKLIGLSGNVERPGLVEIEIGTQVSVVVNEIGGGVPERRQLGAVLAGGPSGYIMSADALDLPMVPRGEYLLGSGGLIVLDDRHSINDAVRRLTQFNKIESCGKCTPCREGTVRMMEKLERSNGGRGADVVLELDTLNEIVAEASLCALGQMAPNPIKSAIRYFGDGAVSPSARSVE